MKTLLAMFLAAASCVAAELRIPDSEFTFAYDSDAWSAMSANPIPDVWPFTDKALYSSAGIIRVDVGTDRRLSEQQIGELIGEGFEAPTLKEMTGGFSVYTLKAPGKKTEKWLSYHASGTFAYFVFVDAESDFFAQHKSSVLKFLSGLQKKKK